MHSRLLMLAASLGAVVLLAAPAQAAGADSHPAAHRSHHVCATPAAGHAACNAIVRDDAVTPNLTPLATPAGYGPADLQSAYGVTAAGGGTLAIVDAYDLPTAEADLSAYRSQFGLPSCTTANGCFKKVGQTGTSSLPAANASWGQEIALDLDMASASCPGCKILLVEANTASMANLGSAVNTAVSLGANAVSNSYGGSESSFDATYDSSYFNHPGVAITVSSGDSGYGPEYPASSRYVTAVGGTSLSHDASSPRGWTETVWSGAGSGCSSYDAKPSWQADSGCARRTVADVAAVADPNTGVAVYDSTANGGQSGWMVFGGTSVAAPFIAGMYLQAGLPAAGSYPAQYPYRNVSALNDVTSGSNGSCSGSYLCTAGPGYDGPTGLGTPAGPAAFAAAGSGSGGSTGGATACTVAQLLGNPGFETGSAAPWTATSGVIDNSTGEPAHTGNWKAWLDGYGRTHTDSLAQQLTLPAGCTSYQLSFWLHVDTAERATAAAYDTLSVQVVSGSTTTTLATYSNRNAASGYQQHGFDLSGYAGRTITLRFTGRENSSRATSFVIDDTAISVG